MFLSKRRKRWASQEALSLPRSIESILLFMPKKNEEIESQRDRLRGERRGRGKNKVGRTCKFLFSLLLQEEKDTGNTLNILDALLYILYTI